MLRERSKNYLDIINNAGFFLVKRPITIDPLDINLLNAARLEVLGRLTLKLSNATWNSQELEKLLNSFVAEEGAKFHDIAQPLRVALIGQKSSPNIAEILSILGREETLNRLSDVL